MTFEERVNENLAANRRTLVAAYLIVAMNWAGVDGFEADLKPEGFVALQRAISGGLAPSNEELLAIVHELPDFYLTEEACNRIFNHFRALVSSSGLPASLANLDASSCC